MFRLPTICAALLMSTSAALSEDFPRSGYDGAPNGQAAAFVGEWSMGFPEPEGVIVAETVVACDDPILIEPASEIAIAFKSPGMTEAAAFEVAELVEGRSTWIPADNSQTVVAIWLTPDSFHYYTADMGRVNWDDPRLFKRCAVE